MDATSEGGGFPAAIARTIMSQYPITVMTQNTV